MRRLRSHLALAALMLGAAPPARASDDARLDAVVAPSHFSGAILVEKNGAILLDKAYGFANAAAGAPNRTTTSFHIGTLSMQYTAVTLLHLVETHKLSLDNTAGQLVSGLDPAQSAQRVRDLLATPADQPQAAVAYETLARVAAAAAGKPFADVADAGSIASVWMAGTGLDDGSVSGDSRFARGYVTQGSALAPAPRTDWPALAGAASAYTTTRDEMHWLDRFFGDALLAPETRQAAFAAPCGYGWQHGVRFGAQAYWAQGTAPGFSAYVLRVPDAALTVIVLGNSDASAAAIGDALAAQALDKAPP